MKRFLVKLQLKELLVGLATIGLLVMSGCGGDDDKCAGVTCDFGACESSSGQCINPDECRTDDQCLPGYECGSDYACAPVDTCESDTDCDVGVCSDGACVNPSSCESNDDCLDSTWCDDGTCRADPCNDINCARGTCEPGTDRCVSADSCTSETERIDCVAGERCAEGVCKGAEGFCDDIQCERGTCSYESGGCGNAADCDGDDSVCLEGFFCDGDDRCQPDLCVQNDVDCADDGVCEQVSGLCQNAEPCASNDECNAGHLCVEGTCRLDEVACGDATGDGGCSGSKTCEYDADNLEANCQEPDECDTSLDCNEGRQCGGLTCLPMASCQADFFEPNDSAAEATDFLSVASANSVDASVCSTDTDVFALNTADMAGDIEGGTMVFEVNVKPRDIGLGQIELVVTDADGTELSTTTGALGADGHARIEQGLDGDTEYTIEVRADDDMSDAGVRYTLSANRLPEDTLSACETAVPIAVNQRVSGNTKESESTSLSASCSGPDAGAEQLFELDIDAPQEVTVNLAAQESAANLSVSIRERCEQGASELACADAASAGGSETLSTMLDAGSYFIVVEAAGDGTGGSFEMDVSSVYTACVPSSDHCVDADVANVCNHDGGRYLTVNCENGCDPSTGRCFPPQGDTCFDAETIDDDTSIEFELVELNDEYDASSAICESGSAQTTSGPDQTFEIELAAQTSFTATTTFANEVQGSMYVVEDCTDVSDTCLVGADGTREDSSEETLTYSNHTDDTVSVFLIIDTAEAQDFATAQLDVVFEDVICAPQARRCHPNDAQVAQECNAYGTARFTYDECGGWGCASGACTRPDTCNDALDVTTGARQDGGADFTINWDSFTNAHETDEVCEDIDDYDVDGSDAFFRVDMNAGDVLDASLDQNDSDYDPALLLTTDCTVPDGDACLVTDETFSGAAELTYKSDIDQTVYLIADSDDYGTLSDFTLNVELRPEVCDAATFAPNCADSTYMEYCSQLGVVETVECDGGCANNECATPGGQVCTDPIPLVDGDSDLQTFTGIQQTAPVEGTVGSCDFGSNAVIESAEHIYSLDLQAEDILTINYQSGVIDSSTGQGIIYLMEDCGDMTSCIQNSGWLDATGDTFTYEADTTGTVYMAVGRYGGSSSSYDYRLDVDILRSDCDSSVDTTQCADSTTLEFCDPEFDLWTEVDCDGGCSNGACGEPNGQLCSEAIPMGDNDSHISDFSGVTYRTTGTGTVGMCDFTSDNESDSADHYYAIDLLDGELLRVDYTSGVLGDSTTQGVMYLHDDCGDVDSCLANGGRYESGDSFEYVADADGTYYLVVSRNAGTSSSYDYRIRTYVDTYCDPSTTSASCNVDGDVEYCTSDSTLETYDCGGGGCTDATCDDEQANSCFDRQDITADASQTDGTSIQIDWSNYTNDLSGDVCGLSSSEIDGQDAFYEVQMQAGDVLFASLDGDSSGDDPALLLTDDCRAPEGDTCLGAQSDANTAEITYVADTDKTVYLVADNDNAAGSSGTFTLSAELVPNECDPDTAANQCADADTLEFCNELGLWESYSCDGGCSSGECGSPRGKACFDAIPVADGQTVSFDYTGGNVFDPYATGEDGTCDFTSYYDTEGHDRVFAIDLLDGQTLDVSYSGGSYATMMYILTECSDTSSCVDRTSYSSSSGSLTYDATRDGTVYVVIDRTTSAEYSYDFDLTVDIQ